MTLQADLMAQICRGVGIAPPKPVVPDLEYQLFAGNLAAIDFAKAKNCNPSKSHLCVGKSGKGSCVSLTKKCKVPASAQAQQAMNHVVAKSGEIANMKPMDKAISPQPVSPRITRGHLNQLEEEDAVALIRSDLGVSEEEALSIYTGIYRYSNGSYTRMRAIEQGGDKDPASGEKISEPEIKSRRKDIEKVNKYLEGGPKFDGEIYRGLSFDSPEAQSKFLSDISGGFELSAMSSFTSSKDIASKFAKNEEGAGYGVLMRVRNKSGVSIRAFSMYEEEDEVLVPKKTPYKISGEPRKNGNMLLIDLEEA